MGDSMHESIESMHSEALPTPDASESIAELVRQVMGENLSHRLNDNQRASVAWFAANGDRERAHTCRVFLRKPRNEGLDPIMCVYVDSHSFLSDLLVNRDLYLARLANWGFYVSGIEFSVDREAKRTSRDSFGSIHAADGSNQQTQQPSQELVEKVQLMVSQMPATLQPSISKAIIATLSSNS